MGRDDTVHSHEFPLQRYFSSIPYLSSIPFLTLRRAGTGVVAIIALLELINLQSTPIQFNYPLFFDVILVYTVLYILQSLHKQLDQAKSELIALARISESRPNISDEEVPDESDIRNTFEDRFDWALDPRRMGACAFLLGVIVLVIMAALDVLHAYPYLIMNFLYGAAHGLMLPFLFIVLPLLKIVPDQFMNDINGMDPSGVGGYSEVGESIAKAAWYGTILINLDFIILGSVAFLESNQFQTVILGIYITELLLLFGFTLGGTLRVRNVLKDVRDRRIRELQWQFGLSEGNFLLEDPNIGQDTDEMLEIITYTLIFDKLNSMNLWPINIAWWTRFIGSVIATVSVILIQLALVIDLPPILDAFS